MFYKISNRIAIFISQLKNIYRWLPIIWRDRDWDHHYLYTILSFKLKNMEELFRGPGAQTVWASKRAKELRAAKSLAARLAADNYLENALMWHRQRFLPIPFDELLTPVPGRPYSLYTGDPNEERHKSFTRCSKHAAYMAAQDREYLFNYISKKINCWWD